MPASKLLIRSLQRYWRFSRALTLGAQGCVIDEHDRVLLVRHTYRPGWHFPGGGVEKNETIETALTRELAEEAGIVLTGRPALFGVYSNARLFPGDHIALYVVRRWQQPSVPPPNREIAEQGFFAQSELPDATHAATRARINEILASSPPSEMW